ncbi:Polysaccharide deacetylase [hydrothermal vent metagenome]|uniref:Polysaccharide deacetylase n=1 Tax=hydrothermal vent metagenome TaxID=652676 RepID=A0A1W1EIG4_9ZZZZ
MNILTFDIEEWFHILDNDSTRGAKEWSSYEYRLSVNMDRIFKLLEAKNQKATFFCLGWVAQKYPQIIKQIDNYGYEIATHSNMHQLVYEQKREEFREDLNSSIQSLEDIIGKKIITYRAPGFSITENTKWAFEEIIEAGIIRDSSIFPANRSHGGFATYGESNPSIIDINGKKLKEFPITLYKNIIFSGGGYFRLLPYPIIKYLFKNSPTVMTYFHPRDFDATQPIIEDLSPFRKFKSYYGLKGAFNKLERLLDDFDFVDIEDATNMIDWNRQKIITL